jgi:glutamate formiminotransferase
MREPSQMLACVINVSEGRDLEVIAEIAASAGDHCLDVHSDADHNRSVFWLAGPDTREASGALTVKALELLDLAHHAGVHPRIGVVDVVPFVPLAGSSMAEAIDARRAFSEWAGHDLELPCFRYGEGARSLPEVRRGAFTTLAPDTGPATPHPTAGACAVGARHALVAYNLWLTVPDLDAARAIARELRSEHVRSLALVCGDHVQVSCNLVNPLVIGPAEIYDAVAHHAHVARAELVGLIGRDVLARVPRARWEELDVSDDRTLEARLP